MPRIYLDPSVEETIDYPGGGNEEYYMNAIVDAMIPYLRVAGIDFRRNNPGETLAQVVNESNSSRYDLHLSLRSTPSAETKQGPLIYYPTGNPNSQKAAFNFARNLWRVYTDPDLVNIAPTETLSQINLLNAPSVLLDLANPSNLEDIQWLKNNIYRIAKMLVFALTDYFGLPFDVKREPLPGEPVPTPMR